MELNKLRDMIHENARAKGFYDAEINGWAKCCNLDFATDVIKHAFFAQKIALIHSELSEALEADRNNRRSSLKNYDETVYAFAQHIKDSVEDELADVIIRILDLCGYLGIDIQKHVELKMKYNELREYKHGKEY